MKIKVAVLFGGRSVEHEVSVISGIQAIMSIDKAKYDVIPVYITKSNEMYIGEDIGNIEKYSNIDRLVSQSERILMVNENNKFYIVSYSKKAFKKPSKIEFDVAFPIVHGTNVEDGTLQGYLKTIGVPYVGCDVTSSALCMDKYLTKQIVTNAGIPTLECSLYSIFDCVDIEKTISDIEEKFSYPIIVKPVNLGSSVGISIANNRDDLLDNIDSAFSYAKRIIIEPAIKNLREINCSVLGDNESAIASVCEEPLHHDEILSYSDKYTNNSKGGSKGMASVSRKIPAEISDEMSEMIKALSVKAFNVLGCSGVVRIDYLLNADNNKIYFNEINTIPGSLAFYLWEQDNINYAQLLDRLIQLAIKRSRNEESITYAFDTNILNNQSLLGAKGAKC